MIERAGERDAPASGARRRLIALDVARGLMLVVSVGVNAWLTMPAWFAHAPWAGVHPLDLVFPVFVTLSGCGLAFAFARRIPVVATLRRVAVLLVAGFAYNALGQWAGTGSLEWASFRIPGVLQLYAALVLAMAALHVLVSPLRRLSVFVWPALTLLLAAAYTWWLAHFASGCPGGELLPECNPSGALDARLFGAEHLYRQGLVGHDPEGVVAVLGAVVATAGGASVGHVLIARGLSVRGRVAAGAAVIGVFALAATVSATVVPPMKRLWTPPFTLGVAAGCGVVLIALFVLLDARRTRDARDRHNPLLYALVALGRNSLLVYFGSHAVMLVLAPSLRASVAGDHAAWVVVIAITAWTALACLLHSRRIYIKP